MTPSQWQRVRELFEQVLELPESSRAEFLQQQCGGEDALLAEVNALLLADSKANAKTASSEQLADAAPALLGALAADRERDQSTALQGQRIGPWRLLHELGRGGMGRVFLAERADGAYVQRVAVKLLRDSWPTALMEARLHVERQLLAGLGHPGIARLLDGGSSEQGWPYLVMEYVDGLPISEWCVQRRLGLRERLQLFLQVCAAVAHAHTCLVVHRDLKPANILVSDGQVKLLDFGIAKLLQDGADGHSATVRAFTPEYAAPEQVRGEPVTTGVDVHALGLLLYELLTGRRAFGHPDSTPAAYEHAILHQTPPAPSLSAADTVGASAEHAANCQLSAAALTARLRGDLDAIVLMALRKEPGQRYASVAALAEDVQRHLDRRPVLARRGRWRYQAGRFLRRHALASGFATLALLAVFGGLAVALWQANVARAERDKAQTALATAEQVTEFLTHMLSQATPDAGKGHAITVLEVLDQAAADVDQRLEAQPEVRARVQMMLAVVFDIVGSTEQSEPMARGAIVTLTALHGARSVPVSEAMQTLANILRHASRYDEAQPIIDEAYAISVETLGAEAEGTQWMLSDVGIHAYSRGDYARAADAFGRALEGVRKLPDANVRAIANILQNHAAALMRAERYTEAEADFNESLAIRNSLFKPPHTNIAIGLHQLGVVKAAQKQHGPAADYFRQAREQYVTLIGPDAPNVLGEDLALARLELDQGHLETALDLLPPLLERHRRILGSDDEDTAICATELALALQRSGQPQAAQALITPAIAVLERSYPEGHDLLASALQVQLALDQDASKPDCDLAARIVRMLQRSYAQSHAKVKEALDAQQRCGAAAD